MSLGLAAIIAIGVILAAICLQTRQEAWSYPEAVAGALFLVSGAVFPLSVLPMPIQAIGLADPLTWWLEGVRQALFPGGLSAIGGSGSLYTDLSGQLTPGATTIVVALLPHGGRRYTRSGCRVPLERTPGQGSWAHRPDDGLLGRPSRSTGASRGRTGFVRIYEGSPRQDFEEVFRSIGAFLDQRAMQEILLAEAPDGFIVQGLVSAEVDAGAWSESIGTQTKETLTFLDDDIARFMDDAVARRNQPVTDDWSKAGYYERAFRVLGRYMDEQKPRDTFFFEQDGAFVVRLLMPSPTGSRHVLAEFTREDIDAMIAQGPALRDPEHGKGKAAKADA